MTAWASLARSRFKRKSSANIRKEKGLDHGSVACLDGWMVGLDGSKMKLMKAKLTSNKPSEVAAKELIRLFGWLVSRNEGRRKKEMT